MTVVTCRDGTSPDTAFAPVAVAPVFPSDAALASFGLSIDRVRFIVMRPSIPPDTLADTTVALPADAQSIDLDLRVPLISSAETLYVSIVAMSGTIALFEGTAPVEVFSGVTPSTPTEIPVVTYVGPGAAVDSIVVTPAVPFLYFNDSLRFQVAAYQAGLPITQFYVSWATSDSTVARVNSNGVLRAPASRTSVRVIARTPGGIASDSATATFVPLPTQLLIIAGGGQTAPAGQTLTTQLEVEVRAADNLPVPGVGVRFRSLSSGTPADTTVTSDAQGRASVRGVLGSGIGVQSFQATIPAFPAVTPASFNATATGVVISPATSLVTVSSGGVVSGNTVKLRLQAKEASGSDITTGGATVVFTRSGGASTGSISATADSGNGVYTAVFTGVLAGTATTIGANINGAPVTSTLPAVTVFPGAISPSTSIVTVSSDTVASDDSVTLRLQGKDVAGNSLTTGGAIVSFSFLGGSSSGSFGAVVDSGTGVYTASFTGIFAGSQTTITAMVPGGSVTTPLPSLTVIPGTPAQLIFVGTPPPLNVAGSVLTPAPEVHAADLHGNPTPAFVGDVTIAIGTSPSGGALSGTATQTATAGVATFADLVIDLPGIGYTLITTAGGLASDTTVGFDVMAAAGIVYWANGAGGNWSNPANWNGGAVPSAIETAAITIPGTYTVTLDIGDTIAGLQLGGSSGSQTLLAASRTLHVSGTTQVNPTGVVDFRASVLQGGTLSNGGTVLTTGSSTIGTAVVTTSTSLIRVQGNSTYGQAFLTVLNGFVNNGVIRLTDTTSSYGATMSLPAGTTLTNSFGATIEAAVGAAGLRTLTAALDNQGILTLSRPLTINRAGAVHTNTGTINVSGGDLTLTQSGAGANFFTAGDITIAAGRSLLLSGGSFAYAGGTIAGAGTLSLTSTTATLSPTLSTGAVGLVITSSTVGGTGTLAVGSGADLDIKASTINAAFDNQGLVTFTGSSSLNGAVTNAPGATLRVQGNSTYGQAFLTVASSFTNAGAIVLTDTTSSYGATLTMPAGATLTNAAGATFQSAVGAAGLRTLTAALDNQGLVTLNRPLTINRVNVTHVNSGTIDVSGGDLTLTQSGVSASFTMSGTGSVTIAPSRTFAVSGGALNYTSGSISGGTLTVTSSAVTSTQPFNTATSALILTSSTWGGGGTITVSAGTLLDVRASTINAALVNQSSVKVTGSSAFTGGLSNPAGATITVQGNSTYGQAFLTVGTDFTNGGAIVLTDTTSSYGATLTMPTGTTLTNAPGATIDAATGSAGVRTLAAALDNQGTLTLNRPLTINRGSAVHANSGTINVVGGDLTLTQFGAGARFTTSGSISVAPGHAFTVSGAAFDYTAGTISGGGAFSLTSTTVTATQNFSTATAALSIASSTWGGTGTLTVAAGTSLLLRTSTINGPLVNQALLTVHGSSTFGGTLVNAPGATMRVQGNSSTGLSTLTVASGFTNDGAIELTDTTSSYGATLTVSAGILLNAATGSISALQGFNGPRTLNAAIDNRGTISVASALNQGMTISRAGAQHQNRGTISVASGDLVVTQTGTTPSFRNTGTISVAAGDTLKITGGSFVYDSGTIGGAGALSLTSLTGTGAFNIPHSIASMIITSSTVSFATGQSTGATGFVFASAVVNGPGQLTNDSGQFLNVRASTINADLFNQGTLLVNGVSNFSGTLTTSGSSLIRVQGNGTYGLGTMTVGNAFTNNGTIELTDIGSSYGATLNNAGGTLTNAPGATIAAVVGSGGARTLNAQLDNQGTVSVTLPSNGALALSRSGAAQLNSGTIAVSGGDLNVTQTVGGTFTNSGSISLAGGDTLRITGGAFTHNSGSLGGAGALLLTNVTNATFAAPQTVAQMTVTGSTVAFATPQTTGATGFSFASSTINGPGSFTNDAGRSLSLRSTVVNTALSNLGTLVAHGGTTITDTLTTATGSLIRVQGDGISGLSTFTVPKGFENAGTIELTDVGSLYGATLAVTNGRLVNLPGAFIDAVQGSNGPRTITAALDNQGSLRVLLPAGRELALNRAASVHTNSGTMDISGGNLAITGNTSLQNLGAITLGATDTLSINGGTFSYDGGSLEAGTLVLSSVGTALFNKPHTLAAIVLNSSNAVFSSSQTTDSTSFTLTGSSIGGTGTLTNAALRSISMRSSGISAPFVNEGTLIARGNSSLDAVTTVTGSTLRVEGDGTSGLGTLTVNGGLVNNGAIELTDIGSSYGATLVVKTLPLVNAGTIDIQPGANGSRTIDAVIDNQGTFTAGRTVSINHADAVHTNRGLYKVKAGTMTFVQSGGNPSFTNLIGGSIDIDGGTVFAVTAGTVTNDLGGKISGSGALDVRAPASFFHNGEILPGASPGKLTIAGNLQIPTSGIITIELGGPTAGTEYDQLAITGAAFYAEGTLNVTAIGAFDPKGLSFDVVTFGPGSQTGPIRTANVPPGCNQPVNTGTSLRIVCP